MEALTGLNFIDIKDNHTLERMLNAKVESLVSRMFKSGDYNINIRLDHIRPAAESKLQRCTCAMDLFILTKNLHIVVEKARGTFLEAINETVESLKEILDEQKNKTAIEMVPPRKPKYIDFSDFFFEF